MRTPWEGSNPAPNASCPPRSYFARFSGSERTPNASETSLKLASAVLSPGFTSGWYFRASLRYAALRSFSVAVRGTPRIS